MSCRQCQRADLRCLGWLRISGGSTVASERVEQMKNEKSELKPNVRRWPLIPATLNLLLSEWRK
jgi:hypothetical protein